MVLLLVCEVDRFVCVCKSSKLVDYAVVLYCRVCCLVSQ